jgi:hypothetical protein
LQFAYLRKHYIISVSFFAYSGLGLGQYISAGIVERCHGRKIGVNSEAGRGNTVWYIAVWRSLIPNAVLRCKYHRLTASYHNGMLVLRNKTTFIAA